MPSAPPPLFLALADSIEQQIRGGAYRTGDRLPSLRRTAHERGTSKNTVIAAFELLVARGLVEPRRGAGFFVKEAPARPEREDGSSLHKVMDMVWLLRMQLRTLPGQLAVGDAFPPSEWLMGARLDRSYHKVARGGLGTLFRYGDRLGYAPLRNRLVRKLGTLGLDTRPEQIVLTQGANTAMDLIVRCFVPAGAAVLIDDPGYYPLLGKLRLAGARAVGVPRQPDGPDLQALERLLVQWRPRLFFTQSLAHNPTGSDLSPEKAHALRALAARHRLLIVENDALADFRSAAHPRLAALDGLERTIYVGSFSKSLSAALRVGFIACHPDLAEDLANLKILTTVNSSEYAERTVDTLLGERHYPRHLETLGSRLEDATQRAYALLDEIGATVFTRPQRSLFIWTSIPGAPDAYRLAQALLGHDVVMAPGNIFQVDPQAVSPWSRCNAHAVLDPRFRRSLGRLLG